MFKNITLRNFGPLTNLLWEGLAPINLIIGANGSGKTFLLKALYIAIRTIEEYKRGNDKRSSSEILIDKLYWTFQVDKIGDLVSKGTGGPLVCSVDFDGNKFSYSFGHDTTKQIASLENQVMPRESNSIFLPAKEVLSIQSIILKSRDQDRLFGFDDTYLDLVRVLTNLPAKGKNYAAFAESRTRLNSLLEGKIQFDDKSGHWYFIKSNQRFPIGVTAEGIKKIAILDTLLGNRYLDPNSLVFIDEPESALHPTAISDFLEIISILAQGGMQFFLASHSYFVVKKLLLIAQKEDRPISVISHENGAWTVSDLRDGMPQNSIIEESIRLYREEMEFIMQ
jgi:AAA15 family ATPase/GTPase